MHFSASRLSLALHLSSAREENENKVTRRRTGSTKHFDLPPLTPPLVLIGLSGYTQRDLSNLSVLYRSHQSSLLRRGASSRRLGPNEIVNGDTRRYTPHVSRPVSETVASKLTRRLPQVKSAPERYSGCGSSPRCTASRLRTDRLDFCDSCARAEAYIALKITRKGSQADPESRSRRSEATRTSPRSGTTSRCILQTARRGRRAAWNFGCAGPCREGPNRQGQERTQRSIPRHSLRPVPRASRSASRAVQAYTGKLMLPEALLLILRMYRRPLRLLARHSIQSGSPAENPEQSTVPLEKRNSKSKSTTRSPSAGNESRLWDGIAIASGASTSAKSASVSKIGGDRGGIGTTACPHTGSMMTRTRCVVVKVGSVLVR